MTINKKLALSYLGVHTTPDQKLSDLLSLCEMELLAVSTPKATYRIVDSSEFTLIEGNDIKTHLDKCEKVILICATLGNSVDTFIRALQISDMEKAVVVDSLASVLIEQVQNSTLATIKSEHKNYCFTTSFGIGYGDYPITLQQPFLSLLDAPRKIGLCTTNECVLTPTKSITGIVGMSKNHIENKKSGCLACNLKDRCNYRKRSENCDL